MIIYTLGVSHSLQHTTTNTTSFTERYPMGLYHISKGTSQANFVQNLVRLTIFERVLLKQLDYIYTLQ